MWSGVAAFIAGVTLVGLLGQPASAIESFPSNSGASYQLGGAYAPEPDAHVVVRDRTSAPVPDHFNVCYLNAFQTQPGELRWWRSVAPQLLLRKAGRLVIDLSWNEVLLDTSTLRKRRSLARILNRRVVGCQRKGFQAVELDNLDSFTRSRGRLVAANNLDLARRVAVFAHHRGLAVGQKNAAELTRTAKASVRFDFAIAEECEVYSECDAYTRVYGPAVIEIEYADNGRSYFSQACAARGRTLSVLYRDRNLVPAGMAGHVSESC